MSLNSEMGLYVIGTVESSGKWDSINYNDPITVGVGQWFGTRAATLLKLNSPERLATVAEPLRTDLAARSGTDQYWNSRYLEADEGESLRPILGDDAGKTYQLQTWESDWTGNVAQLGKYGFSEERVKPLIMLMCALHQSPKRALNIANNYGGQSDLDRIYAAIMNEPVLGQYKNRYNTTYKLLNEWDGTSQPPGFGFSLPGTGDTPTAQPPAQIPSNPLEDVSIGHITRVGDTLLMHTASGQYLQFAQTGGETWVPLNAGKVGQVLTPINTQPPAVPGLPPGDPQTPSSSGWVHPCPARAKISSTFGPRWGTNHNGTDLAGPIGTPIYAPYGGVVLQARASGSSTSGFGYVMVLKHDDADGTLTAYGHSHINQFLVKVGDKVTAGQHISGIGNEGGSTGPHVHIEVYTNGTPFRDYADPQPFFQARGVTL